MSLRELYQEMMIDHGKSPRNLGTLISANRSKTGHNPLCGDHLTLYLLTENEVIQDIKFCGNGCAISIASASLMTEMVKGKTNAEAEQLFSHFHTLVTQGKTNEEANLGKLTIFAGVAEYPARVKCASLAWHTLIAALNGDEKPVCTE